MLKTPNAPARNGELPARGTIKTNDRGELLCPRCDGEYLHQERVTVYDRNEDSRTITKIGVSRAYVEFECVVNGGSGNPSARRDGLAIQFICELCGERSELTLAQHKGVTETGWRVPS
jgi:hypothetical protein